MPTILNNLVCNGATSSALGLKIGYQQLVTLNQPNALNVVLFFTDGAIEVNLEAIRRRSDTSVFQRIDMTFRLAGPSQQQAVELVEHYKTH